MCIQRKRREREREGDRGSSEKHSVLMILWLKQKRMETTEEWTHTLVKRPAVSTAGLL
jgi:hypothetical protein